MLHEIYSLAEDYERKRKFKKASEVFTPRRIVISVIANVYEVSQLADDLILKRLTVYSSVSDMGNHLILVTMSLFTHSLEGYIASVIMMIAHALISSRLLVMSSFNLYNRFYTRTINCFQ